MKIGISTSVIQRGKTGIAQYLFALLRGFQSVSRQDQFVLFVLEEDQSFFRKLDDRFQIVTVEEKWRPAVKNILWHQTVLPALAQEHGLEVLHVPSYRRLLARKPCALVATIHDLAPFRVSGKYDPARMLYGKVVVKRLARRQDEIIAVSQNTANDINKYFGIPARRVRVIHNGLEHERFFRRSDEEVRKVREKHKLAEPFFLYVARLEHPGKNHVRLIESFERFQAATGLNWSLAFGGSDWHGAEAIHERIKASPARAHIRTLGFISDEELPALYSAAETFIYPSLYEGFGMPPLEAMACGAPVICSAAGSLGEVVGDAAMIVDPLSVESISAGLIRVATEDATRGRLRRMGLDRAGQFSWQRCAEETLAVYQAAVRPMRARRESFQPELV